MKDQEINELADRLWNEFMANDKYNDSTEFNIIKIYELESQNKELIEENKKFYCDCDPTVMVNPMTVWICKNCKKQTR